MGVEHVPNLAEHIAAIIFMVGIAVLGLAAFLRIWGPGE